MDQGTTIGTLWLVAVVGGPVILAAVIAYGVVRKRTKRG